MSKILVLYYSAYGHVAAMASAIVDGARQTGASVTIKRVPELMDDAAVYKAGHRPDETPIATVAELVDYDAIIFGTPSLS